MFNPSTWKAKEFVSLRPAIMSSRAIERETLSQTNNQTTAAAAKENLNSINDNNNNNNKPKPAKPNRNKAERHPHLEVP